MFDAPYGAWRTDMRTFQIVILACLVMGLSLAAGCGGSDDPCAQTGGCGDPPPESCGNNVCEPSKGEGTENCHEDCHFEKPPTCGNQACDVLEDDENCPEDCGKAVCEAKDHEYCAEEGKCWPEGTDCGLPVHVCSGMKRRCDNANQAWSCCGETFAVCPENRPYFCPSTKGCYTTPQQCPDTGACSAWGKACEDP